MALRSHLFYHGLCNLFDLLPIGCVAFVVGNVICWYCFSRLWFNWSDPSQFSVAIGLTSRTTTVTLRTARVLANSSPTPDAPAKMTRIHCIMIPRRMDNRRTASNDNDLFTPIEWRASKEEILMVTIQQRTPLDEPYTPIVEHTRTRPRDRQDSGRTERRDQQEVTERANHSVVLDGSNVKITEYWDHSREKRAERCVGKDLDDEVNVESIENKGAVVHGRKEVENAAQPGAKWKERKW